MVPTILTLHKKILDQIINLRSVSDLHSAEKLLENYISSVFYLI